MVPSRRFTSLVFCKMSVMFAKKHFRVAGCLILLSTLLSAGCSTFDNDWRSLATTKAPGSPASSILGRWEGSWHSETSDHTGKLRAIVSALPQKPGRHTSSTAPGAAGELYEVRFHALWGWDFVAEYTVEIEIREQPARYDFKGESELGLFFGKYQCDGHIIGDRFFANYTAAGDRGTFEMRRPTQEQK